MSDPLSNVAPIPTSRKEKEVTRSGSFGFLTLAVDPPKCELHEVTQHQPQSSNVDVSSPSSVKEEGQELVWGDTERGGSSTSSPTRLGTEPQTKSKRGSSGRSFFSFRRRKSAERNSNVRSQVLQIDDAAAISKQVTNKQDSSALQRHSGAKKISQQRRYEAAFKARLARRLLEAALGIENPQTHDAFEIELEGQKPDEMIEKAFQYASEARRLVMEGGGDQENDIGAEDVATLKSKGTKAAAAALNETKERICPPQSIQIPVDDRPVKEGTNSQQAWFWFESLLAPLGIKPARAYDSSRDGPDGDDALHNETLSTLGFDNTFQDMSITSLNEILDGTIDGSTVQKDTAASKKGATTAGEKSKKKHAFWRSHRDKYANAPAVASPKRKDVQYIAPQIVTSGEMDRDYDTYGSDLESAKAIEEVDARLKQVGMDDDAQSLGSYRNAALGDVPALPFRPSTVASPNRPTFVAAPKIDPKQLSVASWDSLAEGGSLADIISRADEDSLVLQSTSRSLDGGGACRLSKKEKAKSTKKRLRLRWWTKQNAEKKLQASSTPAPAMPVVIHVCSQDDSLSDSRPSSASGSPRRMRKPVVVNEDGSLREVADVGLGEMGDVVFAGDGSTQVTQTGQALDKYAMASKDTESDGGKALIDQKLVDPSRENEENEDGVEQTVEPVRNIVSADDRTPGQPQESDGSEFERVEVGKIKRVVHERHAVTTATHGSHPIDGSSLVRAEKNSQSVSFRKLQDVQQQKTQRGRWLFGGGSKKKQKVKRRLYEA